MAYILEFTVTGLGGRGHTVHQVLDRHVNVFWGLNGTGKTTLLKILHAALHNDATGLEDLPFRSAEVLIAVGDSETSIVRSFSNFAASEDEDDDESNELLAAEVIDLEELESAKHWSTRPASGSISDRLLSVKFEHSYLPVSRVVEKVMRTAAERNHRYYAEPSSEDTFLEQVRRRWSGYSTKSLTEIRDIQQKGLAAILAILFGGVRGVAESLGPATKAEVAYELVQSFLNEQGIQLAVGRAEFISRYDKSREHQSVVARIEDVTGEINNALRPQREFQSVIDELYTGNKHLVLNRASVNPRLGGLRVELAGKAIPLAYLSSGEKQLLQLLLEVLASSETTVMIDEPELSMHVDWQQRLVASMRRINSDCQLLLATHSPEVMVDVPDSSIFEL